MKREDRVAAYIVFDGNNEFHGIDDVVVRFVYHDEDDPRHPAFGYKYDVPLVSLVHNQVVSCAMKKLGV